MPSTSSTMSAAPSTEFDVIVIGAGPAGLTAAYELARAGKTRVAVLEATDDIGGISKTVNHLGNRIDIGGHRFFSKSDWVMNWWQEILPLEESARQQSKEQTDNDNVMLTRSRLSRIYFGGQFFDYPLKPNMETAWKLGLWNCMKFGFSYLAAKFFPRPSEDSLEDFMINRFGKRLYLAFFKDYTEKVWGVPCNKISAEWGAQRIKSLSVGNAIKHALMAPFRKRAAPDAKDGPTSLIERFYYPKYGPGQMWERTAQLLQEQGVTVLRSCKVKGLKRAEKDKAGPIVRVRVQRTDSGQSEEQELRAGYVISTMPVRDLVLGLEPPAPKEIYEIAEGLQYRDFITVGLLYKKLMKTSGSAYSSPTLPPPGTSVQDKTNLVPDNWIYIQDRGVKVGRLQFFNNWSPFMVADPETVWVGMEYFCQEGDALWTTNDQALLALGKEEMQKIRLAAPEDCIDGIVIRMPKAYPGYYGTYARFDEVRAYLDAIPNLFLVGRNGMHRYNNQDHSMLSAKYAVDAILSGNTDKAAIWAVNIDDEYHEEAQQKPGNENGR